MKASLRLSLRGSRFGYSSLLLTLSIAMAAGVTAGCGSNTNAPSGSPTPPLSGNTSVVVLATSAANDQLTQFQLQFTSITLTSQSGKTVTLLSSPETAEFVHLNGTAEPLATVSVPQDVYTSATAVVGAAQFACVELASGDLNTDVYAYGYTPSSQVNVNLPAPITITGKAMGLSLDLLVSKSATFPTCVQAGIPSFSINPTFNLAPVDLSSRTAGDRTTNLQGFVASVDGSGNGFTVTGADWIEGPSWQLNIGGGTVYQGIGGASGLATGLFVDMDVAIQADGSLLATRVAVDDTDTTNLSVYSGPLLYVIPSNSVLYAFGNEEQGYLFAQKQPIGSEYFSYGNAMFQTSGALTNVQDLPFPASFTAANMVPGQNVLITSHATTFSQGPTYVPATTITLTPQTIDGTVTSVSSDGNFTTYTIELASYDLMPMLAVQPDQPVLLTNPSSVVVYVDSGTQMFNSSSPGVGGVYRFNGLLFNDNGTLKLDCAWVNDGVTE
jgi:hypothetical protein